MEYKYIPHLGKNENGVDTLYVDGAPYLILGGELHNSSASDFSYMEERVWPFLKELKLNTVLLPVAWEDIEPEEGKFDFSLLEGILKQAKREGVRLVLLWFGLWKNGESFYVPGWMKADTFRFFRAIYENGDTSDTISPFCHEAVEMDKNAFEALMEYLREEDQQHTVIMVQVENEIGFLKSDRDYSPEAEKRFKEKIPSSLQRICDCDGTWKEAFGKDAGEYFMAWHYAKAVEEIASAGKRILPLPMYVNAWLEQHPDRAGSYPSGGPVAKLIPLWREAAPSIDMCCPDIYVPGFREECQKYHESGNTLFIPEAARSAVTASNMFYAFGAHDTIGYSPFGIEDILFRGEEKMEDAQLKELNILAEAFDDKTTAPYLIRSYELIYGLWEKLLECRGTDRMRGYIQGNRNEAGCIIELDEFDLQLDYLPARPGMPGSAGILFPEKDGFYIIGCRTRFTPLPKVGSGMKMGLCRMEEGIFEKGKWKRKRILNGDESYQMILNDMPQARYVKVYF